MRPLVYAFLVIVATTTCRQVGAESFQLQQNQTTVDGIQAPGVSAVANSQSPSSVLNETYGRLPISFEENLGQAAGGVQFLSRGRNYGLFLTKREAVLHLWKVPRGKSSKSLATGATIHLNFIGGDPSPSISGAELLPGKSNYFIGNDPAKWFHDIPQYGRVRYHNIYEGVDVVYYGDQKHLEYDMAIAPGADLNRVRLGFRGVKRVEINSAGELVLHTNLGDLRQRKPTIYQKIAGKKHLVDGGYQLHGSHEVGFWVAQYDHHEQLVIDPQLTYSTFIGGSDDDWGGWVAVDSSGNAYVAGFTASTNFPTGNLQPAYAGGAHDAFIIKLNSSGNQLLYSTYIGGSGDEWGRGIAIDGLGNAYVVGFTTSSDFPMSNAIQSTYGGGQDGFLLKLNSSGSQLLFSTYIGGSSLEEARGIALDASGNIYVVGTTASTNFPTVSPLQGLLAGGKDAFLMKVNNTGSQVIYATYLGGSADENGLAITIDSSNEPYITGYTSSTDFPTTVSAFQASNGGGQDVFVSKVNAAGTALLYSTYLGGASNEQPRGIALDGSGNILVAGYTSSTNFPTVNAFQSTLAGMIDCFIAKLNPSGSALVYSTYLGGSLQDFVMAMAVDNAGNAYITGQEQSTNFPITSNAFQTTQGGGICANGLNCSDVFITKVSPAGSMLYSSFFGGDNFDEAQGIAVDGFNNVYLTGETYSANFPVSQGSYQPSYGGGGDAFIAKLTLPSSTGTNADLAITNSASPGSVSAGSTVTYTLFVTNNGPMDSSSISVTNDFPGTEAASNCSATNNGVCSISGNNVTVTFSSLAASSSATITLTALVNSGVAAGTNISDSATVTSATPDPSPGNNSSTATVTVSAGGAISLAQTDTLDRPARVAYCSGLAVNTSDNTGRQASSQGAPGTGDYSVGVDANANNKAGYFNEILIPAGVSWSAGTWTISIDVTQGGAGVTLTSAYLCRLNSSSANQGTIGNATGLNINMSTTGIKTFNIAGSAQSPTAGDKVELVIGLSNSTPLISYVHWKPDQQISSPFQSSSLTLTLNPTSVTGGNSSQGTLTLNQSAPSGGATVTLGSDNSAALVPPSATIPANSTSTVFTINTNPVSVVTPATISASYNAANPTATLTVEPSGTGISLQQSDTLEGAPRTAYCSGLPLNLSDNTGRQASLQATPGASGPSVQMDANANNKAAYFNEILIPAGASWNAGTWTISIDVTQGGPGVMITSAYLCRVNSSNFNQGIIGSATGLKIDMSTAGIKTLQISGNAQTPAPSDKVELVIGMSNSTNSFPTVRWKPDQQINSPFVH